MKDMPKDQMERIMHKLYHKRNFLLRAFVINLVLIIAVWGLSMTDFYANMAGHFMHCPAAQAETYTMDLLGAWKIAGVLFFLVPALAAWWELHACRKRQ
ncbi:MAG: hypothetical protein LBJ73_00670 [Rickettsiales bacterium]|jgi:hypothetical protein|nr:hypothetical protein [Rickettsiales bacterium]